MKILALLGGLSVLGLIAFGVYVLLRSTKISLPFDDGGRVGGGGRNDDEEQAQRAEDNARALPPESN